MIRETAPFVCCLARPARLAAFRTIIAVRSLSINGWVAPEDLRRIMLWLDLNAMRLGTPTLDEAQQRAQETGEGAYQWPPEMDPKNPTGVEWDRPGATVSEREGQGTTGILPGSASLPGLLDRQDRAGEGPVTPGTHTKEVSQCKDDCR